MHAAQLPAACENCRTPLHGAYCHACGQQAANPLRSFHHAVEDVFESFWHLDGRVFRTLRELFVPGRVACNYLAGQRARYIAPLRLFVVLTLLTFFIGQLAVGIGGREASGAAGSRVALADDDVRVASRTPDFAQARSEAEVQRVLARELADLRAARDAVGYLPGAGQSLDVVERELRSAAQQRIRMLRTGGEAAAAPATEDGDGRALRAGEADSDATSTVDLSGPDDARFGMPALTRTVTGGRLRHADRPWHEHDNPVEIAWLPAFGNRWLNQRLGNAQRNLERVDEAGQSALASLALAAVPSALFVLVPVFALLLRVIHLGSPRGYLEHLVVALYSHAFMLIMLLIGFVLVIAGALLEAPAIDTAVDLMQALLWLSVPVYLFVMQQRVYGRHWLVTAGQYLLLGGAYFMLVLAAVIYTVFAGLTSGA